MVRCRHAKLNRWMIGTRTTVFLFIREHCNFSLAKIEHMNRFDKTSMMIVSDETENTIVCAIELAPWLALFSFNQHKHRFYPKHGSHFANSIENMAKQTIAKMHNSTFVVSKLILGISILFHSEVAHWAQNYWDPFGFWSRQHVLWLWGKPLQNLCSCLLHTPANKCHTMEELLSMPNIADDSTTTKNWTVKRAH